MATHMPFLDGETLVFCRADNFIEKTFGQGASFPKEADRVPTNRSFLYRPWKLAFCAWKNGHARSIQTGLPVAAIECSPAIYRENGKIFLSFISGTPSDGTLHYRLYTSSGPTLEELEPARPISNQTALYGFVSAVHICRGKGNELELLEKESGKILRVTTDFQGISRVTFLSEEPQKLLITGVDKARNYRTALHDLTTQQTWDLCSEGNLYKSTVHGETVVFAHKLAGKENRELRHGQYTLSPSSLQITHR
ncbi:hypothetical protein SAMN05444156_0510 [Verrucomicrobium sp. GAS474]|nr:hypothetical protein SAMN05444156_0510 [Verrucomicrobium sp. GAS474]